MAGFAFVLKVGPIEPPFPLEHVPLPATAPGVEPFACARRAFFTQPRWEVVLDRLRKISPSDVFGG